MTDVLDRLADIIESRKQGDPDQSYVARLHAEGLDKILKKIGEEATETVLAAKAGQREQIIHEVADLWFHSLVMLVHLDMQPGEILTELERRFGQSGLQEKARRTASGAK